MFSTTYAIVHYLFFIFLSTESLSVVHLSGDFIKPKMTGQTIMMDKHTDRKTDSHSETKTSEKAPLSDTQTLDSKRCWLCLCVRVCVCVWVPAHAALAGARAAWGWRGGLIGPTVIWPLQILNHLRERQREWGRESLFIICFFLYMCSAYCVCVSPVH